METVERWKLVAISTMAITLITSSMLVQQDFGIQFDLIPAAIAAVIAQPNTVNSAAIIDGQVKSSDIASSAVGNSKLAADSVDSAKIVDNGVKRSDLAANSVDSGKIKDGSIALSDLASGVAVSGPPGEKGDAGSQILTGSGVPSNSLGTDGDFYLNTANGDYYTRAGGSWSLQGNLTGPKGDSGTGGDVSALQDQVDILEFRIQFLEEGTGLTAFDPNDLDNDGLTNDEEPGIGTDPENPDSDGDGVKDGVEVGAGTDPLDSDTDNDGLGDRFEILQATDPLDADADNDGLVDGADEDGDGLHNFIEVLLTTDPDDTDSDDDGLTDGQEVGTPELHPVQGVLFDGGIGTDALDADSDDDGYTDGEEMTAGSDPTDPSSTPP